MPASNRKPIAVSISHHETVLASRNAILEAAGFSVLATMNGQEFVRLLRQHVVDLVVLGDSIDEQERHRLASDARKLAPGARILMVYRAGDSSPYTRLADAYVEALVGPQELVKTARELVGMMDSAPAGD